MQWIPDELEHAGPEHRDPAYVARYDEKTGFDVAPEIELLRRHGLGPDVTLVDLGAGTGLVAAAAVQHCARVVAVDPSPAMLDAVRARDPRIECVAAGFLTYEHAGGAPAVERAGLEILDRWFSESRVYARYVCVKS